MVDSKGHSILRLVCKATGRMITSNHNIHFQYGKRSRKTIEAGAAPTPSAARCIPRVSKIIALAIRLDRLIRDCQVTEQGELARLGYVTWARLTQITNLLCLTPDIQEEILFLPATERGRDAITERELRPIAAVVSWGKQWGKWRKRD